MSYDSQMLIAGQSSEHLIHRDDTAAYNRQTATDPMSLHMDRPYGPASADPRSLHIRDVDDRGGYGDRAPRNYVSCVFLSLCCKLNAYAAVSVVVQLHWKKCSFETAL